ncbi:MAG: hypothetical protein GKR89_32530 [Candidatus Latescibacteria bacterium]|nr:hypothetical protein [Candidatus Latescibacterota bacterium]
MPCRQSIGGQWATAKLLAGLRMDIYRSLGVEPLINAAGTLTRMSGSVMLPEVVEAMEAASRHFVDMEELHRGAGRRAAELVGVEAAHICACATAGIALMAAACMAGTEGDKIRQLPDTAGLRRKFAAFRAHRNGFDQALRLAGGQFVEVDDSLAGLEDILQRDDLAGVFYTFSWFCPAGVPTLPQVTERAARAGVPVIVDAAAEIPPLENLRRFVDEGAALVAFSGGKALRGPQASGLVLGRADMVEACRLHDSPNMGVGRGMKAGKEEIVGLVRALELYSERDHDADRACWDGRLNTIERHLQEVPHVQLWRQMPYGLGQLIPHLAIQWDENVRQASHQQVQVRLKAGQPRIAVQLIHEPVYAFARDVGAHLRVHPHTLQEGEEEAVGQALRQELGSL